MFIVQRYGLKQAVGLHRGSLIPGVDLDWGGAICGSPRKRLGGNRNPQISKRPAEPDVLAQLCVQALEPGAQLIRSTHGAQGVVFVHDGDAEDSHHRVADELLHRTAVALEDLARHAEIALHHATEGLGVEALAERRRSGHVAEQDRDDLPKLPDFGRLDERRPARVAEPSAGSILMAARRAGRHVPSVGRNSVSPIVKLTLT